MTVVDWLAMIYVSLAVVVVLAALSDDIGPPTA